MPVVFLAVILEPVGVAGQVIVVQVPQVAFLQFVGVPVGGGRAHQGGGPVHEPGLDGIVHDVLHLFQLPLDGCLEVSQLGQDFGLRLLDAVGDGLVDGIGDSPLGVAVGCQEVGQVLAVEALVDAGPVVQAHLAQVLPERQVGGIQGRYSRKLIS